MLCRLRGVGVLVECTVITRPPDHMRNQELEILGYLEISVLNVHIKCCSCLPMLLFIVAFPSPLWIYQGDSGFIVSICLNAPAIVKYGRRMWNHRPTDHGSALTILPFISGMFRGKWATISLKIRSHTTHDDDRASPALYAHSLSSNARLSALRTLPAEYPKLTPLSRKHTPWHGLGGSDL